jgi:hypothetical protein
MKPSRELPRCAAILAINLLFLMVWGFTGLGKIVQGKPAWFGDKFGNTILARFPGLDGTFWLLAIGETTAFLLAVAALARAEFLRAGEPFLLRFMLAWSLFIFVQLGFGQWLTNEFNATFQLFTYFAGTLLCLRYVESKT